MDCIQRQSCSLESVETQQVVINSGFPDFPIHPSRKKLKELKNRLCFANSQNRTDSSFMKFFVFAFYSSYY